MRKVLVVKWLAKASDGGDVEESTVSLLNAIINSTRQEDMPKGIEHFRLFTRLVRAFDKSSENGIIELEEADYSIIHRMFEKGLPAIWAMNKDISRAVEGFLNTEAS